MKKTQVKVLASLLIMLLLFAGCKKATERAVDCFGESLLVSLHVTVNATNAKQVNTEVKYVGSKQITNIKWEYGDGSTQSTTSLIAGHTYTAAGSYTVKARVTFTEGKASCEVDPTKSVTIQ